MQLKDILQSRHARPIFFCEVAGSPNKIRDIFVVKKGLEGKDIIERLTGELNGTYMGSELVINMNLNSRVFEINFPKSIT